MSYFGAGYYGPGYYGAGYWGGGSVTPPVVDDGDTHDGFKEQRKRRERDFRSARERLRETLTQAWDGPPGPVAAEVKALASPFVDVLESGALRIDHEALEARRGEIVAEVLALQEALRAEYQAAREEEDEEDVVLLTWS